MHLAVVGVTGLVGQVMLEVLDEMNFEADQISFVASANSVGKKISWRGKDHTVIGMQEAIDLKPNIALFSAGGSTSLEWAPKFAAAGCFVIDNSSAWRMEQTCPLVVPEINGNSINAESRIIANPNCSTIQMVVALKPLFDAFGIQRLVISTYQSFTGTGMKAVQQYEAEKAGKIPEEPRAYHHPIFENCIPQCDSFLDNLYTKEEMKLVNETRKILGDPNIKITATAVRVPVYGGHSESVNIELKKDFDLEDVKARLNNMKGLVVMDDPNTFSYPTPQQAHRKNEVYVGRIRRDESRENCLNLWITADNLRKGAATNAVQIAKYLVESQLVGN